VSARLSRYDTNRVSSLISGSAPVRRSWSEAVASGSFRSLPVASGSFRSLPVPSGPFRFLPVPSGRFRSLPVPLAAASNHRSALSNEAMAFGSPPLASPTSIRAASTRPSLRMTSMFRFIASRSAASSRSRCPRSCAT
jgi:hypothetical protein